MSTTAQERFRRICSEIRRIRRDQDTFESEFMLLRVSEDDVMVYAAMVAVGLVGAPQTKVAKAKAA